MKTKIIFIIITSLMKLGLSHIILIIYNFNRMRKIYISKYTNYRDKKLLKDSYCEYYIEAFGKFRLWMFNEFLFKKHYTIKHFFNDTYVYKSMLTYYIKESGDVEYNPKMNEIFAHWKDELQSKH